MTDEAAEILTGSDQPPVWMATFFEGLNRRDFEGGLNALDDDIELTFGITTVKGAYRAKRLFEDMAAPLNVEYRVHRIWQNSTRAIVKGDAVLSRKGDVHAVVPPYVFFFSLSAADPPKIIGMSIVAGPLRAL